MFIKTLVEYHPCALRAEEINCITVSNGIDVSDEFEVRLWLRGDKWV
jgi:hypothetical protein